MNKRAMEMWQIVLLVLAIIFLFVMAAWYAALNNDVNSLLSKVWGLF